MKSNNTLGGALRALRDAGNLYKEHLETGCDTTTSRGAFMIARGVHFSQRVKDLLTVELHSVRWRATRLYDKLSQKGKMNKQEMIALMGSIVSEVQGILINLGEHEEGIEI